MRKGGVSEGVVGHRGLPFFGPQEIIYYSGYSHNYDGSGAKAGKKSLALKIVEKLSKAERNSAVLNQFPPVVYTPVLYPPNYHHHWYFSEYHHPSGPHFHDGYNTVSRARAKKLTSTPKKVNKESALKKLTSSPLPEVKPFRDLHLEFNGINRLKLFQKQVDADDEWQSYWDTEDDVNNQLTTGLNNNKSGINWDEVPSQDLNLEPQKVLTTFAALKKEPEKPEEPENAEQQSADELNGLYISSAELRDILKQRYNKRYRACKFRAKNLLEETILEENEEDLEEENMLMLRRNKKKLSTNSAGGQQLSRASVTFAEPSKLCADSSSSEDEFQGYNKVVVSQNLAEEILDEIYGKYENANVHQNGPLSSMHEAGKNMSLADEILDELYGKTVTSAKSADHLLDDHSYEEIAKPGSARFSKKPPKKVSGRSLRSKANLTESLSMSSLFNDTTRLRLSNKRAQLTRATFEAPAGLAPPVTRPKEPPPPPPPVDHVLLPVTPPRKFFPLFTNEELDRINSVINGQHNKNEESEVETIDDEFSSDEFSEDEFDQDYENLKIIRDDEEDSGNVYDSVNEDAMASTMDSLEEKMSFAAEFSESENEYGADSCQLVKQLVEKASEKTIIFTGSIDNSTNSLNASQHEILISSSSWIDFPEVETKESEAEPVKPPRLKKLARIRKEQEKTSLEPNFKERTSKISHLDLSGGKPVISRPVLLASTLNPNDVDGHRSISTFSASSVRELIKRKPNDKITFQDLKRYAANSLISVNFGAKSLTSGGGRFGAKTAKTGNSCFYESNACQDSIYQLDHLHRSSPTYSEHIYEEIPDKRPLPPIPAAAASTNAKSIFEGASKYEILHYLRDAKDRLGSSSTSISNTSDLDLSDIETSTYPSLLIRTLEDIKIERTDSGVGSESSKSSVEIRRAPSLSKSSDSGSSNASANLESCPDCDQDLADNEQVVCQGCSKLRTERKEIITEIAETEAKYGRDLRIIIEEFYRPMLVAGLLSSDQLAAIFLNADELIQVNAKFTDTLRGAIETAFDAGDEDLTSVSIGKLFLQSLSMLRAFESYCTRQASASLLLTTLEKERELLRIFLKVSQMENSMLRRMNLSSFLMVPVQRVTKYPLLLSRLQKVTPEHHHDRVDIRLAKDKIEAALEQMNKDAKDVVNSSKLWKRLQPMMSVSNSPSKKSDAGQDDLSSSKLRKLALETLGWSPEETQFPIEGRILFTQPNDANWKKVWTVKMSSIQAVLCVQSPEELPEVNSGTNKELIFPPDSSTIKDASLVLIRKQALVRDPLSLENCVVCCEQDWDDCFEIQEFVSKETFVFKGEEPEDTMIWFKSLQFYTQCLGGWRKRRKGLAHIMIDPNISTSAAEASIFEPCEASGGGEASAAE